MKKFQSWLVPSLALAVSVASFAPQKAHALGALMLTGVGEVVVAIGTAGRLVLIPIAASTPALASAKGKDEPVPADTRRGKSGKGQTDDGGTGRTRRPSDSGPHFNEPGTSGSGGYGSHLDEGSGSGDGPWLSLSDGQKRIATGVGLILGGDSSETSAPVSLDSALEAFVTLGTFTREQAATIQTELAEKVDHANDRQLHLNLSVATIEGVAAANGISTVTSKFVLISMGMAD